MMKSQKGKTCLIVIASFLFLSISKASSHKVQNYFEQTLQAVNSEKAWKQFVEEHKDLFPKIEKEAPSFVKVERVPEKIEGENFTLGEGYRQTFIKASPERVIEVLNSPWLFKSMYGLDADADIEKSGASGTNKAYDPDAAFKARIYKSVPLIPNQDYILEYTGKKEGKVWLQKATLLEDKENFALRDNLKAVEPTDGGVIFREISMIYVLRWYVRFFGPQMREIMTKELKKVTDSTKCVAEAPGPLTPELGASCWAKFK